MKTLDDFDDDSRGPAEDPAPVVDVVGRIRTLTPDGEKTAAWWGTSRQLRGRVALVTRDYPHRIRKLGRAGAYAISNDALDLMAGLGIQHVLVREPDTGDVYRYSLEDFVEYGERVPDAIAEYPKADPQTWVDRSDPIETYTNHAHEVRR